MKNNFTCIIIDDEPKAIGLLQECLAGLYPNIDVVGSCSTWNAALATLRDNEYDIVFMDISMPGKSGMDLLSLVPSLTAEIIFVTAHSEFALNAFKFSPSGYVLKPINDKNLATAVDKAIERIQYRRIARQPISPGINGKIGIPDNKGISYLSIQDIVYLEATNSCTKVITANAEIISSYNLSRFRTIIEKHNFFQVHRSYIVNLNAIRRYTANSTLIMVNGSEIPISKNLKEEFLLHFDRVSKNH